MLTYWNPTYTRELETPHTRGSETVKMRYIWHPELRDEVRHLGL